MKKMILTFAMALIGVLAFSQNVTYVNGYYKSNGTYVQGHYRTVQNNKVMDNFSTYPNVNPYTGEIGTKHITDYNSYNSNYQINNVYINTTDYSNYTLPSSSYQFPAGLGMIQKMSIIEPQK